MWMSILPGFRGCVRPFVGVAVGLLGWSAKRACSGAYGAGIATCRYLEAVYGRGMLKRPPRFRSDLSNVADRFRNSLPLPESV